MKSLTLRKVFCSATPITSNSNLPWGPNSGGLPKVSACSSAALTKYSLDRLNVTSRVVHRSARVVLTSSMLTSPFASRRRYTEGSNCARDDHHVIEKDET